ncbi:MAG: DUF4838 domain-containing protein [Thermoguttaceae bacterium]|nr:DUF4838 domain-containing protein [Thermoguttaceae bacterium]
MNTRFFSFYGGWIISVAVFLGVSNIFGAQIARDGESDYQILIPDSPTPAELKAAEELQYFLREMTGAQLNIIGEQEAGDIDPKTAEPKRKYLAVGASQTAKQHINHEDLKPDEIPIEVLPNDLILLTGGKKLGTLNAVYVFLEKLGIRFWTADFSHIPKTADLRVENGLRVSHAPALSYRAVYQRQAWDTDYSLRNRLNGHRHRIPKELGGNEILLNWVHSFYHYLPPSKYFEAHPDWYAEINGKRVSDNSQLCLTNEEMTREVIRNVLAELREKPNTRILDLSQNDNRKPCVCSKCSELDQKEGSQAASLIQFVNKVAEAVEKEFPNVLVETLAYQYTRKIPKTIRPRDNVLIRLCSIECSFLKPLDDPTNAEFAKDMEDWRKISKQLFVWDYATNYHDYIGPFPNLRAIGPNIKYFVKNGCIGLFEEAEGDDFAELRNWVQAQLMWDASLDPEKLKAEFLEGYYGSEAAPFIQKYLDALHDRAEKVDVYLGCFGAKTTKWLDLETMNKAQRFMNQAVEASQKAYGENSPYFRHLRKTKLAIDSVWLYRYASLQHEAVKKNLPYEGPKDLAAAADDFEETCAEFGIHAPSIGQSNAISQITAGLKQNAAVNRDLPDFCKNIPSERILILSPLMFLNVSNRAKMVNDPAAVAQKAMKMDISVNWNLQYHPEFTGKYRIYASLRCEGKEKDQKICTWGLYDTEKKRSVKTLPQFSSQFMNEDGKFDSNYRWFDLGSVEIPSNCYLWFAHGQSPDLDAFFIDRVIFIAE